MLRTDLNPDQKQVMERLVKTLSTAAYAPQTAAPGVIALGDSDDVTWVEEPPLPEQPPYQRSVKQTARDVSALQAQAEELLGDLAGIDDRLGEAAALIQEALEGPIATGRLSAEEVAAYIGSFLRVNTSQLTVTEDAYISELFAKQIAASLAAFNSLVVTRQMLDGDVSDTLQSVDGKADSTDLTALETRVSQVEPLRDAVVIEPDGITITDGRSQPSQVSISNDRLSFVSQGTEVAYIDGGEQVLHIDRAEIGSQLVVGHHLFESLDSENTIVRWIS